MTNNLKIRLSQHKENIEVGNKTFASKYNIEFLVYYEKFTWVEDAIFMRNRNKQMEKKKEF